MRLSSVVLAAAHVSAKKNLVLQPQLVNRPYMSKYGVRRSDCKINMLQRPPYKTLPFETPCVALSAEWRHARVKTALSESLRSVFPIV